MTDLLNEREVSEEVERKLRYTPSEFVDRAMASAGNSVPAWRRGLGMGIPALAARGLGVAAVAAISVALVVSLRHSSPAAGSASTNVNHPIATALGPTSAPSATSSNGSTPGPTPGGTVPGSHATAPPSTQSSKPSGPQSPSAPSGGSHAVILGDTTVEALPDSNGAGIAEAFQFTATSSAPLASLSVYVDSGSTGKVIVGLYSSNSTNPVSLLTSATLSSPVVGAWNTVNVSGASLVSGQHYWIALLSPDGTLHIRDAGGQQAASCASVGSNPSAHLNALPATWSTARTFTDCPVSAYGHS